MIIDIKCNFRLWTVSTCSSKLYKKKSCRLFKKLRKYWYYFVLSWHLKSSESHAWFCIFHNDLPFCQWIPGSSLFNGLVDLIRIQTVNESCDIFASYIAWKKSFVFPDVENKSMILKFKIWIAICLNFSCNKIDVFRLFVRCIIKIGTLFSDTIYGELVTGRVWQRWRTSSVFHGLLGLTKQSSIWCTWLWFFLHCQYHGQTLSWR